METNPRTLVGVLAVKLDAVGADVVDDEQRDGGRRYQTNRVMPGIVGPLRFGLSKIGPMRRIMRKFGARLLIFY